MDGHSDVGSEPARGRQLPPRREGARATAAAAIYAALREEIVWLRRRPGEPVAEKEIAAAYGVSRTPVREAVQRLADEGLIEIFPQSGTFVARIAASALLEAIVVRKALEETTARLAAERATRAQVATLDVILRRQREFAGQGDRQAFHAADEAFHAAVAEAAGHPGIWTFVQQVKVQVDRFRQLTLPQKGRMALAIREHGAVAAGIRRHDAVAAAQRMGEHLERLVGDIDGIQRLNPDYFFQNASGLRPGGVGA